MRCETQVAYIVLEQNLGTDLESGQSSWLQQGILQKNQCDVLYFSYAIY